MDLHQSGFLGGRASLGADLSLIIILVSIALLTLGVVLVRSRRYEAHRWVQSGAVALNLVPVVVWMIVSFSRNLLPGLPGDLSLARNDLALAHVVVGAVAAVFGVVVVVRAQQLTVAGRRVSALKTTMRAAYLTYLAAAALGVAVYFVTYG
jgi:uncharacterized membrane protein YozB (DUF420 family)